MAYSITRTSSKVGLAAIIANSALIMPAYLTNKNPALGDFDEDELRNIATKVYESDDVIVQVQLPILRRASTSTSKPEYVIAGYLHKIEKEIDRFVQVQDKMAENFTDFDYVNEMSSSIMELLSIIDTKSITLDEKSTDKSDIETFKLPSKFFEQLKKLMSILENPGLEKYNSGRNGPSLQSVTKEQYVTLRKTLANAAKIYSNVLDDSVEQFDVPEDHERCEWVCESGNSIPEIMSIFGGYFESRSVYFHLRNAISKTRYFSDEFTIRLTTIDTKPIEDMGDEVIQVEIKMTDHTSVFSNIVRFNVYPESN